MDRESRFATAPSELPEDQENGILGTCARALRRIGDKYPHSLPENPRRLQEKFNQFFQGGKPNYEMLVTGKFGTRNAAKVATNEQQSVIIKLLSDHRNFDNEQVVMFYNIIAEQMSWTQITVETIRRYRRKYALLTSAGRLGDTEFRNRLAMQVKRRRPKFPLYMWSWTAGSASCCSRNMPTVRPPTTTAWSSRSFSTRA